MRSLWGTLIFFFDSSDAPTFLFNRPAPAASLQFTDCGLRAKQLDATLFSFLRRARAHSLIIWRFYQLQHHSFVILHFFIHNDRRKHRSHIDARCVLSSVTAAFRAQPPEIRTCKAPRTFGFLVRAHVAEAGPVVPLFKSIVPSSRIRHLSLVSMLATRYSRTKFTSVHLCRRLASPAIQQQLSAAAMQRADVICQAHCIPKAHRRHESTVGSSTVKRETSELSTVVIWSEKTP
jgi:hypothetical protein